MAWPKWYSKVLESCLLSKLVLSFLMGWPCAGLASLGRCSKVLRRVLLQAFSSDFGDDRGLLR
jgi:hypothetical protein